MSEKVRGTEGSTRPLERVKEVLVADVEGLENLPTHGAAIVAFNHVSVVDGLLTRMVGGRRITFPGTDASRLKSLLVRFGRTPEDELAPARRVLERGELLGIFPEGSRSPDGRLYRGETTVAELAFETGVPVIPAGVLVEPGRVLGQRIVFGEPLDLSRFGSLPDRELALRVATDTVVAQIAAVSGQVYVDRAASDQRVALHQARRDEQQAARERAALARAEREEQERQARAAAEAEAAELARAHARAADAARAHAERAAAADEARRQVRSVRLPNTPSGVRDLNGPSLVHLDDEGSAG